MPKLLPQDLDERIVAVIGDVKGEGAGINELHSTLGSIASRRTLQRRLSALVENGRVETRGRGRGLRYVAPALLRTEVREGSSSSYNADTRSVDRRDRSGIPVSDNGKAMLRYVRQPIQQREPVGYNRSFLDDYVPNTTAYLSPGIREHMQAIGRTPDDARPAGTYARDIMGRLLIDLSWASSKLEGNTYSRLDTQHLIEYGEAAAGKDRFETQMILNHKAAIEMLIEQADEVGFNMFTFFNLHALLSENLLADPSESGRLRSRIVQISGTDYHPMYIPQQVEEHFRMMLQKADEINDPFEQAFFIMVHVPYLQPFIHVNKRVSRLAANIPLIKRNLSPLSFIDVPEHLYVEGMLGVYELNDTALLQDVFVWAYERSCKQYTVIRETVAEPDPLRLRYREVIIGIVGDVVRGLSNPHEESLRETVSKLVEKQHIDRVTSMVLNDLANLHEGNVARYRLRLSEYRAWFDTLQK